MLMKMNGNETRFSSTPNERKFPDPACGDADLRNFERVLNGMGALLYISDPETDELLYATPQMMAHLHRGESYRGFRCWELLREKMGTRCPFCPLPELMQNPEEVYVWEEKNPVTGGYYRNTDCLIEWFDGRLVHLHHMVDITEIKNAETALQQRLNQQELMFALSQNFISTLSITKLIPNALRMVGEFMNVSKVVLMKENKENKTLDAAEYIWYNDEDQAYVPEKISMPLLPGTLTYDHFIAGTSPYLAFGDVQNSPECVYPAQHGIKSLLDVPIYVDGLYWGSLSFNECKHMREWTPSDIQLARHIGSVISGAVSRNRMEEKLERMSSIVESSPQFVAYVTAGGSFEYVNPGGLSALWGYTEKELTDKGLFVLFSPKDYRRIVDEIFPQVIAEGRKEFELPMIRKNGEKRTMAISTFRAGHSGEGIGMIASDITEKRLLEEQLILATEHAEESSKAKGEFLSRMSHEMRTPLNAVIGMTSIARAAKDLEKKEYCLEKIEEASVHLLGVINDILDMSKIEAKKFELSFTDFNFEEMLKRVVNVIAFRVDEKNQNLIINLDEGIDHSIVSDGQRLAQVIANLLSNAVKFTPEGGTITLDARKIEEENDIITLQVQVRDTGIGLTAEQQSKLFKSFEQADGSISCQFGGTGLGLAISKSIVEMMEGSIWVESVYGEGATFAFTARVLRGALPLYPGRAPFRDWGNLRILAVDDSPEVREYFRYFADSLSLSCELAADGTQACEILRAHGEKPFDVVFVDWQMPGMDGLELTRRIKEELGQHIVVIMISAYRWNDIENEAKEAGVDRFLSKPLFNSQIVDCINECLGAMPTVPQTAIAHTAVANCFEGRSILLVEDIEVNREIVQALLEDTGIAIDCAENGRIACEMFAADPKKYDLIFMDVHMPEMDGYEATRCIREMDVPQAAAIPIVAMTANAFREDIERCLAAGMNDHVSKPIDVEEMYAKLRKIM